MLVKHKLKVVSEYLFKEIRKNYCNYFLIEDRYYEKGDKMVKYTIDITFDFPKKDMSDLLTSMRGTLEGLGNLSVLNERNSFGKSGATFTISCFKREENQLIGVLEVLKKLNA